MTDKPTDLHALILRALSGQMELGVPEVILRCTPETTTMTESRAVSVETALATHESFAEPANDPLDMFGESEKPVVKAQCSTVEAHCAAISNCQNCPLGATRTKFVYGVGNPRAEIMFIGEAPGAEEDRRGEPFVGRAGQLLDRILAAVNFDRTQVYIANILECRPPENRDPLPEEMAKCFPYLQEQVALIRPKLICALGRIAGQALLKTTTPLGKLRGRWHEYQGVPMLVTYHPAALLRFPAYKRDTWEDVQMLRKRYDEVKG